MEQKLNDILTLATLQDSQRRAKDEQLNQTSQIPFQDIPNGKAISNIVRIWMAQAMDKQRRLKFLEQMPAPRSVYTWGEPNTEYNIKGEFVPSTPEMIGLQRKTLRDLVYRNDLPDPRRHHVLAHELAHFHNQQMPTMPFVEPNSVLLKGLSTPAKYAEQYKSKQIFYDSDAPVDEKVADVLGTLARSMMEAKQEDDYRYANAPLAKPR